MNKFNFSVLSFNLTRLTLGLLFIFSGFSKLFPIHLTELNLVYHHITNWVLSPYLARLLIISEIVIGIALIFGVYLKRLTVYVALFFTVIFSIYLAILLFNEGNNQNCGCFGSIFPMTPAESLIKNAVIISFLLFLLKAPAKLNSRASIVIFASLSTAVSASIIFFFPIYTWLNVNPTPNQKVSFDFNEPIRFSNYELINLKKDEKLVGIFNMACDNCREVAYKLAIIANKEKFANLYLILVGEKDEIEPFLKETHLNYPYKRYNFFEFIKLYPNSSWPWILLISQGKIKKQWVYETFDVKNFKLQLK